MSLTGDIYTHLSADSGLTAYVGTRIYPEWNASNTEDRPQIVYSLISQDRQPHLGGASGLVRSVVQFDVDAKNSRTADAVAERLRLAMDGYVGSFGSTEVRECHLESRRNDYERPLDGSSVAVYRASLDFYMWHTEAVPTFV